MISNGFDQIWRGPMAPLFVLFSLLEKSKTLLNRITSRPLPGAHVVLHTVRMYPRNTSMVAITSSELSPRREGFRGLLETNYRKHNLVHLNAGSVVPLLKKSIWLVVNGMVKQDAVSVHGDELLLGLAGPTEPFGEPLSTVEAYETVALSDCDFVCLSTTEVEQAPQLALAMVDANRARYRQAE